MVRFCSREEVRSSNEATVGVGVSVGDGVFGREDASGPATSIRSDSIPSRVGRAWRDIGTWTRER